MDHTDEERNTFKALKSDDEREQFIEQFWLRRDPDPDTDANEYREEYYQRIAYANEHFSSGIPGWKTDRGRIYIMFGPPDGRSRILPAAVTTVLPTKAVGRRQPTRSKRGGTGMSKGGLETLRSSSSTRLVRVSTGLRAARMKDAALRAGCRSDAF